MKDAAFLFTEDPFLETDAAIDIPLYSEQKVTRGESKTVAKQVEEISVRFNKDAWRIVFIPPSLPIPSPDGIGEVDRTNSDVYFVSTTFRLSRLLETNSYLEIGVTIRLSDLRATALKLMPDHIYQVERNVSYAITNQHTMQFDYLEPVIAAEGVGFYDFEWHYECPPQQETITPGDKRIAALIQVPRSTRLLSGTLTFSATLNKKRLVVWEQRCCASDSYPLQFALSDAQWLRPEASAISSMPDTRMARSIAGSSSTQVTQTCKSIVILTTNSIEYEAIYSRLAGWQKMKSPEGTIYEQGTCVAGNQAWQIFMAEISDEGSAVTTETERAIQHFHPNIVVFIGTANGIKDVQPGDVVIPTKVYDYEQGLAGETFQAKPGVSQLTYQMEQLIKVWARDMQRQQKSQGTSSVSTLHLSPIAAGAKELVSPQSPLWKFLNEHYNGSLAITTQATDFLEATRHHREIDALSFHCITRMVADVATIENGARERAARSTSEFLFALLSNL